MEFKIRKAKLSDAKGLAELYFQFWVPHTGVDPLLEFDKKVTLKRQIEFAKKDMKKRGNHILVADMDGKIIGFVEFYIKKNDDYFKIKKYGYLESATTHKKYRGKGVAKALTQEAIRFLKSKGIIYVRTTVYDSNDVAMQTWTKIGFVPQATILNRNI